MTRKFGWSFALVLAAFVAGCSDDESSPPTIVAFGATPTQVEYSQSALLTWDVQDGLWIEIESCTAVTTPATDADWCAGGMPGVVTVPDPEAPTGVVPVRIYADSRYRLVAHGAGASVVRSGPVDVDAVMPEVPAGPWSDAFYADPSVITGGQSTELVIAATGATQFQVFDVTENPSNPARWTLEATLDVDGTGWVRARQEVSPTASTLYMIQAAGADSLPLAYARVSVIPGRPDLPQIVDFAADPARVDDGEDVTLSWTVLNATAMTLDPPVAGFDSGELEGSVTFTAVFPPTATGATVSTTYTLTVSNGSHRAVATAVVTVTGAPEVTSFTALPATVVTGESVELAWTAVRTDHVTITAVPADAALAGSHPATGRITLTPAANTTYTLTAVGATTATDTATASVVVGPPPMTIDSFTATPATIAVGGSSVLAWTTTNATSVVVSAVPADTTLAGPFAVDGTETVSPLVTTVYTLTASRAGSTNVLDTVTVTVTP